jgi:N-dimethylarginine dimethylaminohydrolase
MVTLLMCRPDFFDVSYSINPWMHPSDWQSNATVLLQQAKNGWRAMEDTLKSLGVSVKLITPQPSLPDMVFTANAAIVLDGKVLLSRFRHKERQGEEKYFADFFNKLKEDGTVSEVQSFPKNIFQEGAGDCTWDSIRQIFWAGYGARSSKDAIPFIETYFNKPVVALQLATEEFYHIDVSLCPLSGGHVMYAPEAFTKESICIIQEHVARDKLIAVDPEDARNFALNSVNLQDKIILSGCSKKLENLLKEQGYSVIMTPVETFAMSGGSVFCMTLRLDWLSSQTFEGGNPF